MKRILLISLSLSTLLLLSGCGFDESLEKNQLRDGDDLRVIGDVWPQALDQVMQLHSTHQTVQVVAPQTQPPVASGNDD